MSWKVIVDISPKTIQGTKDCHEYVFDVYKNKKEACEVRDRINSIGDMGKAYVENQRRGK